MKLFKKKRSKEKYKKITSSTYEVIDISLENPRDILSLTGSGIVGSSIQAQKASRMIIMINKDHLGVSDEAEMRYMRSYDLMVWEYDDRNVFYVAGSMSNFYTMCVSMALNHRGGSFTDYVLHVLLEASYKCRDKYAASLFTNEQLSYFNSISIVELVITLTEKYMKDMTNMIDPSDLIQYEVVPIRISLDHPRKATIMSMGKFSLVGKDNVLVYANPRQIAAIEELVGNVRESVDTSMPDGINDDMIATEVIE